MSHMIGVLLAAAADKQSYYSAPSQRRLSAGRTPGRAASKKVLRIYLFNGFLINPFPFLQVHPVRSQEMILL
jgi:hypothetical protein